MCCSTTYIFYVPVTRYSFLLFHLHRSQHPQPIESSHDVHCSGPGQIAFVLKLFNGTQPVRVYQPQQIVHDGTKGCTAIVQLVLLNVPVVVCTRKKYEKIIQPGLFFYFDLYPKQ